MSGFVREQIQKNKSSGHERRKTNLILLQETARRIEFITHRRQLVLQTSGLLTTEVDRFCHNSQTDVTVRLNFSTRTSEVPVVMLMHLVVLFVTPYTQPHTHYDEVGWVEPQSYTLLYIIVFVQ